MTKVVNQLQGPTIHMQQLLPQRKNQNADSRTLKRILHTGLKGG
jgi:hypothetical protein